MAVCNVQQEHGETRPLTGARAQTDSSPPSIAGLASVHPVGRPDPRHSIDSLLRRVDKLKTKIEGQTKIGPAKAGPKALGD